MRTVLTVEGVGKAYARKIAPGAAFWSLLRYNQLDESEPFWAVRDVSFSLGEGESVGIIGRNGSGKSTLLQLICGISPPSEGVVRANGRIASLLELGAGFDTDFTGRENVFLNAAMLGLSRAQIEQRFDEIAAFADIGRFLEEPVRTYSSGMFVRLAFSVAVHVSPEILVVDEALAVGDARFSAKCIKRIKALREGGCTLLFVSHDVGIVRTLCDRAIWLDKGGVAAQGDVFGVTSQYMEYLFSDEPHSGDDPIALPADAQTLDSECRKESSPEPLNHWGSHVGSILNWTFLSSSSSSGRVIKYGDTVRLDVTVRLPVGVDSRNLSVAFSIKDMRGTDLQVCTTHDENPQSIVGHGAVVRVTFEFVNRLTEGKYLLVLALEDRSAEAIQYFEYIEGAHYFSVTSVVRRFGIFNLPVAVTVERGEA